MGCNATYGGGSICANLQYDIDRVFRFDTHSAPSEKPSNAKNPLITQILSSQLTIPSQQDPPTETRSFSSAPSSNESLDDFSPIQELSSSTDDEVEEILLDVEEGPLLSFLYEPPPDPQTREMVHLNSLRRFIVSTPVNIWNFYELLPNISDHWFYMSLGNDGLRHSLLAVAAVVRSYFADGGAMEMFLVEKAAALRHLQEAISAEAIDEALALSVLMHISMDVLTGKLRYTLQHLEGLKLIFGQLKQRAKARGELLSPFALLMQRMLIRLDFALCSVYEVPTQFDSLDARDELVDRQWLTQHPHFAKSPSPATVEWILASFEMDNLMHRSYISARRVEQLRATKNPHAEQVAQIEFRKLAQGLEMWKQRVIIREQEEIERFAREIMLAPTNPSQRFLYHEPLYLQSVYYAKLLSQWRSTHLFNSFILHPKTGPGPVSHNRYSHAVEICRIHAAMGKEAFVGPSWQSLYFAGLVFGGKKRYPMECQWLLDNLRIVGVIYPIMKPVVEFMPACWDGDEVPWAGFAGLFKLSGMLDS